MNINPVNKPTKLIYYKIFFYSFININKINNK